MLLLLLACAPRPDDSGATTVPDDGCTHIKWEGNLPFPSDRLTTPDAGSPTGLRLALDADAVPETRNGVPAFDATLLDGQDGFSRVAPEVVELTGTLDATAIGAVADLDAPMFLLDVGTGDVIPGRLAVTQSADTLTIWPDHALRPGALHAIVVRSALPTNQCFSAGPGYETDAGADGPLSAEIAQAHDAAVQAGLADADIAAVIPFTTRSAAGETATMDALRDAVPGLVSAQGLTLDTVADCATDTLDGYCGDGVAFAVLGHASLPAWRDSAGHFVTDDQGVPTPQGDEDVPFWMLVPEGARTAAAPLVVIQHGLGGHKEDMLGLARHLVADGRAVVAIDAVEHGERRSTGDVTMNFFGAGYDLWDTARGRDNIRQTAADHLALRTLLAGATFDGFAIDASAGAYVGQSLGAVIGSSTCALDTGIGACVLNVPGGRLVEIVRANAAYAALMNLYFDPHTQNPEVELFSAMAQSVVDPADPAITASRVLAGSPARPVLVQEATEDGTIANQTTEFMARTMGIPLLDPSIEEISGLDHEDMPASDNFAGGPDGSEAVTAGLAQFEDEHGFVTGDDDEARRAVAQILTFLDEGRIASGE